MVVGSLVRGVVDSGGQMAKGENADFMLDLLWGREPVEETPTSVIGWVPPCLCFGL